MLVFENVAAIIIPPPSGLGSLFYMAIILSSLRDLFISWNYKALMAEMIIAQIVSSAIINPERMVLLVFENVAVIIIPPLRGWVYYLHG
ncbi:hypothetical protein DU508_12050 [Pedobacter chinensis]|uniref:Uncharacterized protein n=1 Tax=Pedobacter chinensis TaxID=2282421 RepID=A0A369PVQ5_9SPHI|nr:hypothetical protein DU508_12050 [Pedobacter chinensis]